MAAQTANDTGRQWFLDPPTNDVEEDRVMVDASKDQGKRQVDRCAACRRGAACPLPKPCPPSPGGAWEWAPENRTADLVVDHRRRIGSVYDVGLLRIGTEIHICDVCRSGGDCARACRGTARESYPTGRALGPCRHCPACRADVEVRAAVETDPGQPWIPSRAAARELSGEPETRTEVWTARIGHAGTDGLDVTAKSAGPAGRPFAPSWAIVRPALAARAEAISLRKGTLFLPSCEARADSIVAQSWANYREAYRAEMRASWARHRAAWDALRGRGRVTLLCYCGPDADGVLRCHRVLLAEILGKLGADVKGEVGP